jgi:hypothetical protein
VISSSVRSFGALVAVLVTGSPTAHVTTPIGTDTTVISFTNPSSTNQAVDFEAVTVGFYPSGTVTFMDDTTVLCSAAPVATYTSTGIAYCTASFGDGPHTVTAHYSGDSANEPSSGCVVQLAGFNSIFTDAFECVRP